MRIGGKRRKGSALLEFTLAGIPAIFLLISTVEMSRGMWNYHTLARAVNKGARLAAIRGKGCGSPNTCAVTVGAIANQVSSAAVGILPENVDLVLVTGSGATTNCKPLSSCLGNSTVWPPANNNDNAPGHDVTVQATLAFHSALAMFWPGAQSVEFGAIVLPASSTQQILF